MASAVQQCHRPLQGWPAVSSVGQSIHLKFLGFEQICKNALTGLPLGGGKGESDFNPRGRSDREIMRFCHAFMMELHRHIGPDIDVPAGDIGVGSRELGFLFGRYKELTNRFVGTLTGKHISFGGSELRTEATGYGCVYFIENMLEHIGESLHEKRIAISGSGNVALYAAEKCIADGAIVLTLSDSDGFVHDPDGIDQENLDWLKELKEVRRGRIREYASKRRKVKFHADASPWNSGVECDIAIPCATQNEISADDARTMIDAQVKLVAEGANMPCATDAVQEFLKAEILFAPAKAANAGGVAVSGLERSQNAMHTTWEHETVDKKLREIMHNIHQQCVEHGRGDAETVNYVKGANIAGFRKVAEALLAFGV